MQKYVYGQNILLPHESDGKHSLHYSFLETNSVTKIVIICQTIEKILQLQMENYENDKALEKALEKD